MKNSTVRLPRNYTLADLLRIDPIGALYAQKTEASRKFDTEHTDQLSVFQNVMSATRVACEKDPSFREAFMAGKYPLKTLLSRQALAKVIGLSEEDLAIAYEFQNGSMHAYIGAGPSNSSLIRSWGAQKKRAKIIDVGPENFPSIFTRPLLVLYSADWCPPCRIMRPTFARLVPFYDKAEVAYCHDDAWRREKGVEFIPQFVAYFPSGASVCSHVGSTTQELWDTMNNLIVLGQNFQGKGILVCDEKSCAIEPVLS